MLKSSVLFKKNTNFNGNSRIVRIKNAKFSGHYFYTNTNLQGDFQICVRVPLIKSIYKIALKNYLYYIQEINDYASFQEL